MLNAKKIDVEGIGEIEITELSARAYAAMLDARKAGKQEVEVSATVAYYCAFKNTHDSVDDVMDNYGPNALMSIMAHVVELSELSPKKSGTGRAKNLSSA